MEVSLIYFLVSLQSSRVECDETNWDTPGIHIGKIYSRPRTDLEIYRRLTNYFRRSQAEPTDRRKDANETSKVDDTVLETVAPAQLRRTTRKYESFLCFDVEATCEAGKNFAYPNEIIVCPQLSMSFD